MFDGNYRSRRKVNLGGNGRRQRNASSSASSSSYSLKSSMGIRDSKAEVIESTRRQREERRLQQLKQSSSRTIQRIYRGYVTRRRLIRTIEQKELTSLSLSMLLSLLTRSRAVDAELQKKALLQYGNNLSLHTKQPVSKLTRERILDATLPNLRPEQEELSNLLNLIRTMMEISKDPLSMPNYRTLVITCQKWLKTSGWPGHGDDSVKRLWRWTCQCGLLINTHETLALMGITIFCYSTSNAAFQDMIGSGYTGGICGLEWAFQTLLPEIVDSLCSSEMASMLKGREDKVLDRALQLSKHLPEQTSSPHALIHLLQHVLASSDDISMLVSMQIRGEKVRSTVLEGKDADIMKANYEDEFEDEEEDDDDDEHVTATPVAVNKRQKGTSSLSSRQMLQTTPRLDRLYLAAYSRLRQETLDRIKTRSLQQRSSLVEVVECLGSASLWIRWGTAVLGQESASRKAYLWLLARVLQGCSGLKTNTSSPFLSQLAFSRPFLEQMWRQVLVLVVNGSDGEEWSLTSTIIFCDLFAHHLIALSDNDFLQFYTTAHRTPTVVAEHVIGRLRDVLYELYWTRPIVVKDVQIARSTDVAPLRARLLLSGTKLWNALYERWCRLVRQSPFCDETSWLFPRLAACDDDDAVIGSGGNRVHENSFDDDGMEDEIDDMDVDEPTAVELESDALADTFRDPKMARVLTSIPQALPFDRRVKLFNSLLNADKLKTQNETAEFQQAIFRMMQRGQELGDPNQLNAREQVKIHRDALYQDSMNNLNKLGRRLKRKIQVTFINQHGTQEAGIDGGGVFKEFLDDLIKQAFDPEGSDGTPRLFTVTPLETLVVNLDLEPTKEILKHYEFLGRVLGKAVYESILVEPQFCLPFLNQLLGKRNSLEDLKNLDREYYNNLVKLKTLSEEDISNLGLTFELTLGINRTVPLLPGGANIPVTKQNVIHYVHLIANQRLNIEDASQTKAFLRGFRDLVPASWVRLFSAYELQKLVSGDDTVKGIDVASLKKAMKYLGGYHPSQPIVQMFWEVIEEMSADQQKKFLRFMTSCSRQPLLGFQALRPAPCIQQLHISDEVLASEKDVQLPTSATCMNLLKLPNYKNKELLRKKLLASIESGAGFELS